MTPEERVEQLHAECTRLIERNAVLEARVAAERVWRSEMQRALSPLTVLLALGTPDG